MRDHLLYRCWQEMDVDRPSCFFGLHTHWQAVACTCRWVMMLIMLWMIRAALGQAVAAAKQNRRRWLIPADGRTRDSLPFSYSNVEQIFAGIEMRWRCRLLCFIDASCWTGTTGIPCHLLKRSFAASRWGIVPFQVWWKGGCWPRNGFSARWP
jgi:hypothetical protein